MVMLLEERHLQFFVHKKLDPYIVCYVWLAQGLVLMYAAVYMHVCICVSMCVCVYVCVYVCICMFVYLYVGN